MASLAEHPRPLKPQRAGPLLAKNHQRGATVGMVSVLFDDVEDFPADFYGRDARGSHHPRFRYFTGMYGSVSRVRDPTQSPPHGDRGQERRVEPDIG